LKADFIKYQAQTSPNPLLIEVSHAIGSYIYDIDGKAYLDMVAGVSACTLGHQHPKVKEAIINQLNKYAHVMVYGEFAQSPSIAFCKLLASLLPSNLQKTYLVNSGTEATEGALKLARRVTSRSQLISFHQAYHGNTMGAMSVMGFEERKRAFRPLIPDIDFLWFNVEEDLKKITTKTAGVIVESIQGGAGFIEPKNDYLKKLKHRCESVGALLIIDEIQPGFGRTGKLFGYQNYDVVPDILIMGKGMASGMPVGAFTSSENYMNLLSTNPKLGHITTFGGHPVIAASALATLEEVSKPEFMNEVLEKENLFRELLVHKHILEVRGRGLMLAIITANADITNRVILKCKEEGLLFFWLLFEPHAIRITPPLTISNEEIKAGCKILISVLDEI